MESILTSIKKLLGIAEEYKHFDADLIMHINSVFSILTQLGVGPSKGFSISDDSTVWSDFIADEKKIEMVKSYVNLKVKILFDPPTTSSVMEAANRMISELEWRLNVAVDPSDDWNQGDSGNEGDHMKPVKPGGDNNYVKPDGPHGNHHKNDKELWETDEVYIVKKRKKR